MMKFFKTKIFTKKKSTNDILKEKLWNGDGQFVKKDVGSLGSQDNEINMKMKSSGNAAKPKCLTCTYRIEQSVVEGVVETPKSKSLDSRTHSTDEKITDPRKTKSLDRDPNTDNTKLAIRQAKYWKNLQKEDRKKNKEQRHHEEEQQQPPISKQRLRKMSSSSSAQFQLPYQPHQLRKVSSTSTTYAPRREKNFRFSRDRCLTCTFTILPTESTLPNHYQKNTKVAQSIDNLYSVSDSIEESKEETEESPDQSNGTATTPELSGTTEARKIPCGTCDSCRARQAREGAQTLLEQAAFSKSLPSLLNI